MRTHQRGRPGSQSRLGGQVLVSADLTGALWVPDTLGWGVFPEEAAEPGAVRYLASGAGVYVPMGLMAQPCAESAVRSRFAQCPHR